MTHPRTGSASPEVEDEPEGEFVADILDEEEEPQDGSEAPAGSADPPQPPAADGQPAGEPASAEPAAGEAPQRDERGRFTAKGEESAQGSAGQTPAPAADTPPAPDGDGSAPGFTFRAAGEVYEIQGSKVNPDGSLTIPTDRLQEVSELLSRGIHHNKTWRQEQQALEAKVRRAEQQAAYDTQRARQVLDQLEQKIQQQLRYDQSEGREGEPALQKFLTDLTTSWPQLKLQAQQKAFDEERRLFLEGNQQQQSAVETQQLEGALATHVEEVAQRYPGVNPRLILAQLQPRARTLFFRAERDMPEYGLRAGEIGVHLGTIDAAFELAHAAQTEARRAEAEARKTAERNAAATRQPAVPPAVPAGGQPATGGRGEAKIPTFKNRAERDAWLSDRNRRHKDLGITDD